MERDLLGLDKETGFPQKGFCGDDCLYDCSGFLSFVQESLQITMVDYNCYYTPVINAFVIEFSYEGNKYQLLKHNLNDVPEYILSLIKEDELLDRFVVLVRTNDFNDVKIEIARIIEKNKYGYKTKRIILS